MSRKSEEELAEQSIIVPLHVTFKSGVTGEIIETDITINLTRYGLRGANEITDALVLEDLKRPETMALFQPEMPVEFNVSGQPMLSMRSFTKRYLSSAFQKPKDHT